MINEAQLEAAKQAAQRAANRKHVTYCVYKDRTGNNAVVTPSALVPEGRQVLFTATPEESGDKPPETQADDKVDPG